MADAAANPWDVDWKAAAPAAAADAEPWNVDWKAKLAAGPVEDVAKSAGTGLVKGTESLIGLPSDIQRGLGHLVGKGVLSLGDLIGLPHPPQSAIDREPLNGYAPTSENIGKTVEGVTGPMHTPETTPGKYAETVGEFLPGALAMGPAEGVAGAATNATKLAALPGVASEALGEKTEGSWLEPYARLLGAIGGGAVGSAGSKIGEMAANRSAASTAATDAGGGVAPAAIQKVAKNFAADDLTPAAVASRQGELGPESMMLDMGRQLQGRAEAIASQPGKGQNRILDAVEDRTGTFGSGTAQRTKDTLDQAMGPSPDIVATRDGINAAVDRIAKPLYDKVMAAHPVVDVPDSITSRPAVAQAMKDAVSLAKNHGEQLVSPTETKTIISGPGYHIADDVASPAKTSLGYWDYVKKAMDARINGMMKTGGVQDLNSQDKADLAGLLDAKKTLVGHLDKATTPDPVAAATDFLKQSGGWGAQLSDHLSDQAKLNVAKEFGFQEPGSAYAMARKAAATKFQVNDAIDLGRSALNTKLLPEELAEHVNGMSIPERAGVQLGMRREVDRIIDTARNDGAAARRLLDTNQNREKIAQVFGKPAADAVDKRIGAETQFQDATNKISANSRTAVRQQLMKDTEAASVAQPPSANLAGLALSGLRRAREYTGDMSLDRTREGIADLLTRRGTDAQSLAQVLARYNSARAANAAPPMRQQAGSLASVIASQTPGWFNGYLPGNRPPAQ